MVQDPDVLLEDHIVDYDKKKHPRWEFAHGTQVWYF